MKRLLTVSATVLLLPAAPAGAADRAGAAFGSVSLTAVSSGASFLFAGSAQVPAETTFPYASSAIRLGAGSALSTVAWPGAVGANLGSTLITGFGAPQQAEILNDPAVAKAQSGSGPSTVRNTTVPGSTMTAHATVTGADSEAALDGASTLATTAGRSAASSSVALTAAAAAVGDATSSIRDVTIAGLVKVRSVVSTAHATTDGRTARATGSTVVSGVAVAGIPVTVGEHGVEVAGSALPTAGLLDTVESALTQAQITLTVSRPTRVVRGGLVDYATGSLIVSTPAGVLSLGGVQMRLSATLSDPLTGAHPAAAGSVPTAAAPVGNGTDAPLPAAASLDSPPAGAGAPPPVVQALLGVLAPVSLVTGYSPLWLLLGLALLLAAASLLPGLAGRWLPAPDDSCPLERTW
ncbi:MAG: hypothetical protein WCD35_04040 [Mycobacteriales bacterium]